MNQPTETLPLSSALRLELDELTQGLAPHLERCVRSGEYLIAIVTCDEQSLSLEGLTREFPVDRFPAALDLIRAKLAEEIERSGNDL